RADGTQRRRKDQRATRHTCRRRTERRGLSSWFTASLVQKMKGTQMKNGKLNGKVAVVTGASKGIGAGIAKQFAAEGASVVVNYASAKHDADRVVDEISKRGGKAVAIQGSVANKSEVERLLAEAEKA